MKVLRYIFKKVGKGKDQMTLIDPEKQSPLGAGDMPRIAAGSGSNAITVGESNDVGQKKLDEEVMETKDAVEVPTILFPADAYAIGRFEDAAYFMRISSSNNAGNVAEEQRKASLAVKEMRIQGISMGYRIVEPRSAVGRADEAPMMSREDPRLTKQYAFTGQFLRTELTYCRARYCAHSPPPEEMIRQVKGEIEILLIVRGGIGNGRDVGELVAAGSGVVVLGTIVDRNNSLSIPKQIVQSVKSTGSRR